jgi:hypothetical protein
MAAPALVRVVALLLNALVLSLATPCAAQSQWMEFSPRDAGFVIEMPGEWTLSERKTSRPAADELLMHMASVKMNGRAYMTLYLFLPEDKVAGQSMTLTLDGIREGILKNNRDKLRSEKRLVIGEFPAREIIIDAADSKVYVARYLVMKNVMIQAIAAGPPGIEQEPDTSRFLASLKPIVP